MLVCVTVWAKLYRLLFETTSMEIVAVHGGRVEYMHSNSGLKNWTQKLCSHDIASVEYSVTYLMRIYGCKYYWEA